MVLTQQLDQRQDPPHVVVEVAQREPGRPRSDDPAGLRHRPSQLQRDEAGVATAAVLDVVDVGVADQQGLGRHLERVVRRLWRTVRQVDEDADPVHLTHRVAAKAGQPSMHRLRGHDIADHATAQVVDQGQPRTPSANARSTRLRSSSRNSAPSTPRIAPTRPAAEALWTSGGASTWAA